ncbi:MAG: Uma2 family endonuclease [Xenococcaceae cyanobacterium]
MIMTQVLSKPLTFDEYIQQYPEDGGRYELVDGRIIEVRPIGKHEEIAGFITTELSLEIRVKQLPYFIPKSAAVKPKRPGTGNIPDVIVLDKETVYSDPYWEKASSVSLGKSVRLAVEVVSSNWRDDYLKKLDDYEELGIREYWIVDYLAKGAARYIGTPKVPTLSIYQLVDGEYQVSLFKGGDRLMSPTFPELALIAEQVFKAGN